VKSKTQDRDAVGAKVSSVTQHNGRRSSRSVVGKNEIGLLRHELLGESLCCLPSPGVAQR
jgi:hypothetical protein